MMTVAPGFFDTMEIPLLAGRAFEPRDDGEAPRVAVINAAAATEMFATGNPLGRRFGFDPEERDEFEVIGVVQDTRYDDLRGAAPPTVFRSALVTHGPTYDTSGRRRGNPLRPLTSGTRARRLRHRGAERRRRRRFSPGTG